MLGGELFTSFPMRKIVFTLSLAISMVACKPVVETTQQELANVGSQYYQLKTYRFDSEDQQAVTEAYLKDAFLPAAKRLEIGPIGVFKPRPESDDSTLSVRVLVPFESLDEYAGFAASLLADSVYLADGAAYLEAAHDNPPCKRMEVVLTKAFSDMPVMAVPKLDGPRADRIYELRSYESATEAIFQNKVDMFNAGGEVILFDKLGFNAVFYSEVIAGPVMPNLMYMTTHADSASRKANWDSFVNSPEWKAMSSDPKYQNNVSHIDIYFLYPTAYSEY